MIITRTPLRVSLLGGSSDYPVWWREHGGEVLGGAINQYCFIIARYTPPFFEHKSRIAYSKLECVQANKDIEHPAVRECLRFMNIDEGVEIYHDRDLPSQRGLGASSSFTVGLLHALCALKGVNISQEQLAQDAIYIEQELIKESVGCQDQYWAAVGGFNHIIFEKDGAVRVVRNPVSPMIVHKLEKWLMLYATGTHRIASEVARELIKNMPLKIQELSLMQSYVKIGLALLKQERFQDFGKLMHENWMLKRGLARPITNDRIDTMYNTAIKSGAIGGKLAGAGGGGFMLFIVDPDYQDTVSKSLSEYMRINFCFDYTGSQIIFRSS